MNKILILLIFPFSLELSSQDLSDNYWVQFNSVTSKCYYTLNISESEIINKKDINCFTVANKEDLNFMIENIDSFDKLTSLKILNISISDFNFLVQLPNLKSLRLSVNKKINFDSFVFNVNQSKNIYLLGILKLKSKSNLEKLNQLQNIRYLSIENSKLNNFYLNMKLWNLRVFNNERKIRYFKTENIEFIYFDENDLKSLPLGLETSPDLRYLMFSGGKIDIDCPLEGFKFLKIFDVFAASLTNISESCFSDNRKVRVLRQVGYK